jgi:tRNA pseudouridine55 synthase
VQGILLIDKPAGWTSFDAVNYVRKIVAKAQNKKPKQVKVGHSGTLDPFATGLLILLIGKDYTGRAEQFSKLDKAYEATAYLGATSSTGDPEGNITKVSDEVPTEVEIKEILKKYSGEISQTPPIYSAIKIDGKRAYKLARAGKEVQLSPRKVKINSLKMTSYDYPKLDLIADVSSGTYIRALVEDIGKDLKSGAYTEQLRRISIGKFTLENAPKPKDINVSNISKYLQSI